MTAAEDLYPSGPSVPAGFAKPTAVYRMHAWVALLVLLLFISLYVFLSGWFLLTAWRLAASLVYGTGSGAALIASVCAAFMAVFMLKGLVFVKRGNLAKDHEVTCQDQPRLFAFFDRLAAEVGAPRPKRVFLSPQVNACVFYDLSVLNLLWPCRKNLEIGLGLVNVLTLGEFKAVCAHEFGHFAQRTMAVGRWVYVAQQIASQIIAKRDALDDLLARVSYLDLRVAWIGWIMRLIVWSIRSLLESAFRVVVIAERALSRDMEMQADLVAVSLTGSDALVHALHKLAAADDALDRSFSFFASEAAEKRTPIDIFPIQSRVVEKMGLLLGDPTYGRDPARPASHPEAHRLFKPEIAQPPRMWLTHPPNDEREENVKRIYIPDSIDDRPAWILFEDSGALREKITAALVEKSDAPAVEIEESLKRLDEDFDREHLHSRYRGIYYGRSAARRAENVASLFEDRDANPASLSELYPPSLSEDIEHLRTLVREEALLQSISDGTLDPPGGVIRHRGREVPRSGLDAVIDLVKRERAELETRLAAQERLCRSVHLAIASQTGGGWHNYLVGLCSLVHYAVHTKADLRDAQGALSAVYRVATATGTVSGDKLYWIQAESGRLYSVLERVFAQADQIAVDADTAKLLGAASWRDALGSLLLPDPANDNLGIGVWLSRIDSWVNQAAGALESLRCAALDRLLISERELTEHFLAGSDPGPAPEPASLPAEYPVLLPGKERERMKGLDWWTRFQIARGPGPALARTGTALAIVGGVLVFGAMTGQARLVAYNGLARPVKVIVDGSTRRLLPGEKAEYSLTPGRRYAIEARTDDGKPIEAFSESLSEDTATYVYNVAGAAALASYTIYYGDGEPPPAPPKFTASRWLATRADFVLTEPPRTISLSAGESHSKVALGAPTVGFADSIEDWLPAPELRAEAISAHARWDPADSSDILTWLTKAAALQGGAGIMEARLAENPREVVTLRVQQDTAKGERHGEVCQRQMTQARTASDDPDLQYLAARCGTSEAVRDRAYLEGWRRWPRNAWFGYAAGYALADEGAYGEALAALEVVWRHAPPLADGAALLSARIRKMLARSESADISDLLAFSPRLREYHQVEIGQNIDGGWRLAFARLAQGRLEEALTAAKGSQDETHILRLVAASDGAPPDAVRKALALPASSASGFDAWLGCALALRHGLDVEAYRQSIRSLWGENGEPMARFVGLVHSGEITAADEEVKKLPIERRLQAYVFGVIAAGPRAPDQWRENARFMVFSLERPYFR